MIDPQSVTQQELKNAALNTNITTSADTVGFIARNAYIVARYAAHAPCVLHNNQSAFYALCWCLQIQNIDMNLPHQYLQTLLRTTKQFNTENYYSKTIEQIIKQDIDKLELVDFNMLLDISNEYYNIDIQEFNYDNIFSRRNLIETIRREYES